MVGIPVIQRLGGGHPLEVLGVMLEPRPLEKVAYGDVVTLPHRFFARVGAKALDLAPNVDHRLVQRVPQPVARVFADYQVARLRHERGEVADAAADDYVVPFHGDAAARRRALLDYHQTAMAGRPGALRDVALYPDDAGHDVLGRAPARAAVHRDLGLLV